MVKAALRVYAKKNLSHLCDVSQGLFCAGEGGKKPTNSFVLVRSTKAMRECVFNGKKGGRLYVSLAHAPLAAIDGAIDPAESAKLPASQTEEEEEEEEEGGAASGCFQEQQLVRRPTKAQYENGLNKNARFMFVALTFCCEAFVHSARSIDSLVQVSPEDARKYVNTLARMLPIVLYHVRMSENIQMRISQERLRVGI